LIVFLSLFFHYQGFINGQKYAWRDLEIPFSYSGEVTKLTEKAETAGIEIGDRIAKINGVSLTSNEVYQNEMLKLQEGQPILFDLQRKSADGQTKNFQVSVQPQKLGKDFSFYARFLVNFIFVYFFPTFCILLGFWVVFVRPSDFLAWLLLFVLLGLSSLGLEMYPSDTFIGAYQDFAFSAWALAMFLFGVYFPERWTIDKKLPWLKWFFIVPLSFQILITVCPIFMME
jgi:phosphoserine phosphatase RsbU/P